jgi:hypothetical protein
VATRRPFYWCFAVRDVVAGIVAAVLVFVALSLLTTLHVYRRRHQRARQAELERGRTIVVELPTDPELTLFTEDATHFYYGSRPIDKRQVSAVRVLINGSPIAAAISPRLRTPSQRQPTSFEDRPEGIARDRWDVAIETVDDTVLVECGAVRERVSQELARKIFEVVRRAIE